MPEPKTKPPTTAVEPESVNATAEPPRELRGDVEISYFARALGLEEGDNPAATEALRKLVRTCVIRFGVEKRAKERVAEALSISPHEAMETNTIEISNPQASGISSEAWRRLASKMRVPLNEPLLGAHFYVDSPQDCQQLAKDIAELRADCKTLAPLEADLARHAVNALPRLRQILQKDDLDPELRKFMGNCARQIALAESFGVEWTMVHPRERAFMQELLASGRLKPVDPTQNAQLANSLLEPVGMRVKFVEKSERLEPFLNRTRYTKTSLFQKSSVYYKALLENGRKKPKKVISFYGDLLKARKEYDQGGIFKESRLKARQSLAFKRLLKSLQG